MQYTITDNFLTENELALLVAADEVTNLCYQVDRYKEHPTAKSPGVFSHKVYDNLNPLVTSFMYNALIPIMNRLEVALLFRIQLNVNPILSEPLVSFFHSDTQEIMSDADAARWEIAILYLTTNNGYTELEDGTRIESVESRVVTFPSNTKHRFITQTDIPYRILLNFGYFKASNNK